MIQYKKYVLHVAAMLRDRVPMVFQFISAHLNKLLSQGCLTIKKLWAEASKHRELELVSHKYFSKVWTRLKTQLEKQQI